MTIFKPEGTAEFVAPALAKPIPLPVTGEVPDDETIPLTELSVGSTSNPDLPSTKKVALKMSRAEKAALLKKSKKIPKPSKGIPTKSVFPTAESVPITVIEDSEDIEEVPPEPKSKKPRLTRESEPSPPEPVVDAVPVTVVVPPPSPASSSQGTPTTCWPKSPSDVFPFHLFDQFQLPGDDERFKGFTSEDYLVSYIRAQTQVSPQLFLL